MAAYHPYPDDPFSLLPDDSLRSAPYEHVRGQPALIVDGQQRPLPSDPAEYGRQFSAYLDRARSESTFIELTVTGHIDTVGQRCSLAVCAVKLDEEPTPEGLRLYCLVTEDSLVDFLGSQWNRVVRKFLPDIGGSALALGKRFDTLRASYACPQGPWVASKLGAVVLVQDVASRKVYQAAQLRRFNLD
ncbi:MAG: hypothetical protein ABIK62_00325 [candidate division WOR-3 bacterium]